MGKLDLAQDIAKEKLHEYKIFEKDEELSLEQQELAFLNTNDKLVGLKKIKRKL